MANYRIKIVGAGKVGIAFAWHLQRLGYEICDISDRQLEKTRFAWKLLYTAHRRQPTAKSRQPDVVFLTVPDSGIEKEFKRLKGELAPGTIVVHCSGVYGAEVFKSRVGSCECGIETLALHPVRSFFSIEQAIADLPGSFFALDGTKKGLHFGKEIVRRLGGKWVIVSGKDRPLYHVMCVFASNFLNALFETSERIGKEIGISERKVRELLLPLTDGVIKNIREKGPVVTLTGPISRGDKRTVELHIKTLRRRLPELVSLYKELTYHLERMYGKVKSQNS
ncbi:MAG: Rossmann-like and DUF2520 domain-containing protein [candidate division WOR-3 bacterium]